MKGSIGVQGRMLQRPAESDPSADAPCESVDVAIADVRQFIDPLLEEAVNTLDLAPQRLREAIRYALLAPGKRLRPALTLWASDACGGDRQAAAAGAMAVEMIHAYSLVHDDLPAMDDDDLRRGRPTCHRAFDEATAILCGDALQPLAFATLVRHLPPDTAGRACGILASAAGAEALVGGQAEDLAAEQTTAETDAANASPESQLARLEQNHRCKTGALFLACLRLGGLTWPTHRQSSSRPWRSTALPLGSPFRLPMTSSMPKEPKRRSANVSAKMPHAAN